MTEPFSQKIFPTTQLEDADGAGHNHSLNPTMGEIIGKRFSRRGFLQSSLAVSAIAATVGPVALMSADKARANGRSAFSFTEVEAGVDAIIIETQTSLEELGVAVEAAKAASAPCIIASLAYDLSADKSFYVTMMGERPEKAAIHARAARRRSRRARPIAAPNRAGGRAAFAGRLRW